MCLLITGPASSIRAHLLNTPGLIENIYDSNADGLGIMYGTVRGLKVVKRLPATASHARTIIQTLPNDAREVALHWRWRTHGDIDMDNCHPYQVTPTTQLMHNGILSTGNKDDPSKSDTWHFIKDYLADMPDDGLHNAGFLEILGDFIGNNKFAIMSADGRLSVVNEEQGLHHQDVWYSNTYAWSPDLLIPTYRKKSVYSGYGTYLGGYGGHLGANASAFGIIDDAEDKWSPKTTKSAEYTAATTELTASTESSLITFKQMIPCIEEALYQFDTDQLAGCIELYPVNTVAHILRGYRVTSWAKFNPQAWSEDVCKAVAAWTDPVVTVAIRELNNLPAEDVATALVQCCDMMPVDEPKDETVEAVQGETQAVEPEVPPTVARLALVH